MTLTKINDISSFHMMSHEVYFCKGRNDDTRVLTQGMYLVSLKVLFLSIYLRFSINL
jgi:hypothetical protein